MSAKMSSSRFVDIFLQRLTADGLIRPQQRILVALSGGSDSVALLHLLHSVASPLQLFVAAAHLDHAIRPQSQDDADFVRSLCTKLSIPLICERVDVPALAVQEKVGLEEAGRMARQSFLLKEATRLGCTAIALGHHRGDQAETLLHHLSRGCGLHGLAAMRRRQGLFVRPLLSFSKAELQAYLAEIGAEFVTDASNDDLDFTRNRIRHQLLPLFATLNPRIEVTLSSLADLAAQEDDYWQEETARLDNLLVVRSDTGVCIDIPALRALHRAPRFRLLHRILTPFAQAGAKEVGLRHVETLDLLLNSTAPQGELHLPGVRALRRYEQLTLRALPLPAPLGWVQIITGPGLYLLPSGDELRVEVGVPWSTAAAGNAMEFFAIDLPFPLTVRTVQPGDRMRCVGKSGRKRLKELMMEQKIPLERRRTLCVLEKVEILWFVGIRRSVLSLPQAGKALLRIVYTPHNSPEVLQRP